MIIKKLIDWIVNRTAPNATKLDKDDLVGGLAFGLAGGLAVGLTVGLMFGLAFGLAVGLAFGSAFGLAVGLAGGLAGGLAVGFSDFMVECFTTQQFIGILVAGVMVLIVAEVFFWLDKKRPKKNQSKIWFTVERKIVALGEASFFVVLVIGAYRYIVKGFAFISRVAPDLSDWFARYGAAVAVGIVIVGTGIIVAVGFVYINSLKYRKERKKGARCE